MADLKLFRFFFFSFVVAWRHRYSLFYFIIIIVFAGIFVAETFPEDSCDLGTRNFTDAFLFSSITITTVGCAFSSSLPFLLFVCVYLCL